MSSELIKSPMLMLQEQLDKGVSVEQLKGLMDLAERYDKIQAEKAWNLAMTNCQRDMPPLVKSSHNKHKDIWYAGFEQLDAQIRPIYLREGLSLCFTEIDQADKDICFMAVDILHVDGHQRRFQKKVHIDGVGMQGKANMTPTQGDGSTTSYARRYVTKMAFNLRDETDADQDGDVAGNTVLSGTEVKVLKQMVDKLSILMGRAYNVPGFCNWLKAGAKTLEEIPRSSFAAAVAELNRKREEEEAKG